MGNISSIITKVMCTLPKMKGMSGKVHFDAKQIQEFCKRNMADDEILQRLLNRSKNASMDIAYKAKSNYNIAALRLKEGGKTIATGALSITNPKTSQAGVKYRLTDKGIGTQLRANSFIDGGKPVDTKNIGVGLSRKNGIVKADFSLGEVSAHHIQGNEDSLVQTAKVFNQNELLRNYVKFNKNLDQKLGSLMTNVRQAFSGKSQTVNTAAEKLSSPLYYKEVKPGVLEEEFNPEKFNKAIKEI